MLNMFSNSKSLTYVDEFIVGNNVTFNAFFGGASLDFEGINTNTINFTLKNGTTTKKNLFLELTRNPGYWCVPKGLSNTQVGSYYGTALGLLQVKQ